VFFTTVISFYEGEIIEQEAR